MALAEQDRADWQSREQFLAIAARVMRRLLANHARDRNTAKRLPLSARDPADSIVAYYDQRRLGVFVLDQALERLLLEDEDAARVVEMRYFSGWSVPEVQRILGTSQRAAERHWTRPRLWLSAALKPDV